MSASAGEVTVAISKAIWILVVEVIGGCDACCRGECARSSCSQPLTVEILIHWPSLVKFRHPRPGPRTSDESGMQHNYKFYRNLVLIKRDLPSPQRSEGLRS
jgi:hypothetical protein